MSGSCKLVCWCILQYYLIGYNYGIVLVIIRSSMLETSGQSDAQPSAGSSAACFKWQQGQTRKAICGLAMLYLIEADLLL